MSVSQKSAQTRTTEEKPEPLSTVHKKVKLGNTHPARPARSVMEPRWPEEEEEAASLQARRPHEDDGSARGHKRRKADEEVQLLRRTVAANAATNRLAGVCSSGGADFGLVLDEVRYRSFRHGPLPEAVARSMEMRRESGTVGPVTGTTEVSSRSSAKRRAGEEAVWRKQAELNGTTHLYKALARKSFQVSVTLLLKAEENRDGAGPQEPAAEEDVYRTVVLPAGRLFFRFYRSFWPLLRFRSC